MPHLCCFSADSFATLVMSSPPQKPIDGPWEPIGFQASPGALRPQSPQSHTDSPSRGQRADIASLSSGSGRSVPPHC
jgi:hypothetical protein